MLTAALVLGSHAMHDSFAMISWNAAGIDTGTASLIWSESVAAEVIMFFLFGPALLNRLGPGRAAALAAGAGILRWAVMATSTQVIALSLIEPLHGFTFALLHLACMRVIAETVPSHLAATAQALYGTLAAGAANALLTLGSGWLYAHFGVGGFLGDGGAMRRGSAGRARPRTILRRMRSGDPCLSRLCGSMLRRRGWRILLEQLGELLGHGAAQLLGVHDGHGAPVIARHVMADADGDELDRRTRLDLLDRHGANGVRDSCRG